MRNEMQMLRVLTNQLDKATDPEEKERIQEEIWELEEEMELADEMEYKASHNRYFED